MILQGLVSGRLILQGFYSGPEAFASDLIIEDGSGIPNANSYVTVAEARRYAKARGKASLFADEEKSESYLVLATDYLQSITYPGYPVDLAQSLAWPRKCTQWGWQAIPITTIPTVLKSAEIEIAMIIASGIDVLPLTSGPFVTEETVGPITTKYSDKYGFGVIDMPIVSSLLNQIIGETGSLLRIYRG